MTFNPGWRIQTVDQIKAGEKYSCVGGPFGSDISSKFFVNAGVPVIRGGNLTIGKEKFVPKDFVFVSENTAKQFPGQHVKSGDLVFTCWGTLGQVGLIPNNGPFKEYIISNKQLKLRPDNNICNSQYLYYYFSQPQIVRHINDIAIGSAVPGINLGLLKRVKVMVPPLRIQKKIVAIVGSYDDLIENNQRRITLLEKMAEEIYREWFVRLRFPGHKCENFEKGLPSTWEVLKFRDIVAYYIGGGWGEEYPTASKSEGAYVIRGTDIPDISAGVFDAPYRYHKPSNLRSRTLKAGDFVFEVSGGSTNQLLGRNVVITQEAINFLGGNVMCASFCKQIRFNADVVSPLFMKYFMKLFYETDLVGLYQIQSTGISNYQFEAFLKFQSIVIPPLMIQKKFEKYVLPMMELRDKLSLKNIALIKSRNLLLTRLISGKLSVESLDIQFPPSMQESANDHQRP